jgi:hypothetical protein
MRSAGRLLQKPAPLQRPLGRTMLSYSGQSLTMLPPLPPCTMRRLTMLRHPTPPLLRPRRCSLYTSPGPPHRCSLSPHRHRSITAITLAVIVSTSMQVLL